MIIHFHYSIYENSGEIRRIKNIDADVAGRLSDKVVEVSFVSPKLFGKRKELYFTLSQSVVRKHYFPMIPLSSSNVWAKWINSVWMSMIMFFLCLWYKPKYVIGEYNISFQSFRFGPWKNRYIMDCHGDIKDEYVYGNPRPNQLMLNYFDYFERIGTKHAKYIICQSEAMKKLLISRYQSINPDKIYVYKCSADLSRFHVDEELRSQYRQQLGVDENSTLFVYSGGLHKWQKVEEAVSLFTQYCKSYPNSKMLILTLDVDMAKTMVRDKFDDYAEMIIILSAQHEKVCGYLNAADVAFLLRDNVILNAVASPTKLAEYMACGLPVISTEVSSNWISDGSYLFNIDKNEISELHSFLNKCDKQAISSFAKSELSLEKDKQNLSRLIANELQE